MNVFELEAVIQLNSDAYKKGLADAKKSMEDMEKTNESKSANVSQAWNVAAVAIGNIISQVFTKVTTTISSAVDSAISRVDILNNYSLVMQGLGYSAEEADDAIEKLSDGIQGLPTTLPGIVTMQKQFAALYGDMDEATDVALALNDAVLAGGQSQEVANSALNQWYQMIANGLPDAQSWKIINQAMPAQLNQIAQSLMGADAKAQDLFNEWKEGTITTEQVTNAITKLDKEGGDGFSNLHDQALTASKGIATSMQNVKTQITTQLANVIQAMMDGGLDITGILDTTKGEIKDFGKVITESMSGADFKQISDKIKELIKLIFDALKKVDWKKLINSILDAVTKLVTFVTKHFKGILTLVKAIAAAFIGWKIGNIVNSMTKSVGSLISFMKNLINTIKGVEGAQKGLNAAMDANPIGLIITAVTTLIAIFPDLCNWMNEWAGNIDTTGAHLKELQEKTESLATSNAEMNESLKNSASASQAEAERLSDLAEQLVTCTDENGNLLEGEQERAQYILNELNTALGTEYTLEDLNNEKIKEITENTSKLIEVQQARALLEDLEAQYTTLYDEQNTALLNVVDAQNKVNDAQQRLKDLNAAAIYGDVHGSVQMVEEEIANYSAELEKNKAVYEDVTNKIGLLQQAQVSMSQEAYGDVTNAILDYNAGLGLSEQAQTKAAESSSAAVTRYMQNMLYQVGYDSNQIKSFMSGITDDMTISQKLQVLGRNMAEGLGAGWESIFWQIQSRILNDIDSINSQAKIRDDQHSPSKRWAKFAKNQVLGLEGGWKSEFGNYENQVLSDFASLDNYDFGEISASANIKANTNIQNQVNSLADKINENIEKLTNMQIVLDSGELVGATASKMDNALGSLAVKNNRSVFA